MPPASHTGLCHAWNFGNTGQIETPTPKQWTSACGFKFACLLCVAPSVSSDLVFQEVAGLNNAQRIGKSVVYPGLGSLGWGGREEARNQVTVSPAT